MTFAELPMPLSSTLSLGVLVVACALHFMWHPLKSSFSDALDFLRTHRLPLGIALLAGLLSGGVFTLGDELKIGWVSGDFSSLNRDAFNLVRAGFDGASASRFPSHAADAVTAHLDRDADRRGNSLSLSLREVEDPV